MEKKQRKRLISGLISLGFILVVIWMVFFKQAGRLCSYVPDHASWYAEMKNPDQMLAAFDKGARTYADSGVSIIPELQANIAYVKALFVGREDILKEIENQDFGISAHSFSASETGYVFYLSCQPELREKIQQAIKGSLLKKDGFRLEEREYLGEKILDISDRKGKTFGLTFLKTAVVASFSGFLVEEIIRNAGVILKPGFTINLSNDSRYHHIESNSLRIFIQNGNMPAFFRQFLNARELELFRQTAGAMVLGYRGMKGNEIELQGYTLGNRQDIVLSHQSNIPVDYFIPENQIALSFYTGKKELWTGLSGENEQKNDAGLSLIQKALEDEVLIVLAEGRGLRKYDHIMITKIRDAPGLQQVYQRIAGTKSPPFVYSEEYRGLRLFKHTENKFCLAIGGKAFESWSSSFYAELGPYLVVSDQIEVLRSCIDEYLLKKNNPPPRFSYRWFHIDLSPGNLAPGLSENAAGSFRSSFREWLPLIKSVSSIKMQDMGESENPAFSLRISLRSPMIKADSLIPVRHIFLDSVIVSGIVRAGLVNESDRAIWLVQDLKKQTHFLNQNLDLLHTETMEDFWVNQPQTCMLSQKGEFSVLVTNPLRTMVYGPDGQKIPDFAITLPDSLSAITHSALIDYDRSLAYRIYAASRHGYILASDQDGKLLPGWNPKKLESPLALAPRHIRVSGRDYIAMADNRGNILLTNRKGQIQPGFPFKLKGGSCKNWFAEPGLDEANSFLYCMSELGQMEKINLLGAQASYLQLFRPEVNTRFSLHADQNERTFIIVRSGTGSLTVFDQSYRPVFEHKSGGNHFEVRHFQFGSSNKVYAVTDLDLKQCFLYNENGEKILQNGFSCTASPDIFPSRTTEGKFRLLSVFENRVSLADFFKN